MQTVRAQAPRTLGISACLMIVAGIMVIAVRLPFSTDVGSIGPGSYPGVGSAPVTTTSAPATTSTTSLNSFNLGGQTATTVGARSSTTTSSAHQTTSTSSPSTTTTTTLLPVPIQVPTPIRLPGVPAAPGGTSPTPLPLGGL